MPADELCPAFLLQSIFWLNDGSCMGASRWIEGKKQNGQRCVSNAAASPADIAAVRCRKSGRQDRSFIRRLWQ